MFYFQARPLPSLKEAEDLHYQLRSYGGDRGVVLVVREVAAFGLEGGPKFDIFFEPFPDVPDAAARFSDYIECEATCEIKQAGPRPILMGL